jgi:Na+-transporting NADH:ubiquinone oxidoreductase subunit NqrF
MNSNYELFKLKKPTTQANLDAAKKQIQLKLHPDKHPGEENIYTEEFKKIEPAYERIKESLISKPQPEEKWQETFFKKKEFKKKEVKYPTTKEEWLEQKLMNPN